MSTDPDEGIFDAPEFPRFNEVSTGLRNAEERLLRALKSRDSAQIESARQDVMGALDEYGKTVSGMPTANLISDVAFPRK